jgi:nucleotidyltransferase substrate binding protein (TIGR01987 family)
MAKTLELKLEDLKDALDTLEEVLVLEKSEINRDSAIKRFEYVFELLWKTVKVYLREREGIEAFSPKECFRQLRKIGLVGSEQAEVLMEMTADRNEAVHTYSEKFADQLYERILRDYRGVINDLCQALKSNL